MAYSFYPKSLYYASFQKITAAVVVVFGIRASVLFVTYGFWGFELYRFALGALQDSMPSLGVARLRRLVIARF